MPGSGSASAADQRATSCPSGRTKNGAGRRQAERGGGRSFRDDDLDRCGEPGLPYGASPLGLPGWRVNRVRPSPMRSMVDMCCPSRVSQQLSAPE